MFCEILKFINMIKKCITNHVSAEVSVREGRMRLPMSLFSQFNGEKTSVFLKRVNYNELFWTL